jgi:hypothetical protein
MRAKAETRHNRVIVLTVLVQEILNPITAVDSNLLKADHNLLKVVDNSLLVDHNLITLRRRIQEVLRLSSALR